MITYAKTITYYYISFKMQKNQQEKLYSLSRKYYIQAKEDGLAFTGGGGRNYILQ